MRFHLKSLLHNGKMFLNEMMLLSAEMIALLTRHEAGTAEREVRAFMQLVRRQYRISNLNEETILIYRDIVSTKHNIKAILRTVEQMLSVQLFVLRKMEDSMSKCMEEILDYFLFANKEYEPADIKVHVRGKGIVVREKSLVAIRKSDGKCLAFGAEAEQMAGMGREDIVVRSPLRQGMVANLWFAEKLFSHLIIKALGKKPILKPAVAICVPKGITPTPVERMAIEDALHNAGAREIFLINIYEDISVEKYIKGLSEQSPKLYRKIKIFIDISKDESERYIEERLQDILAYAGREKIPRERVWELCEKGLKEDILHREDII